MNVANVAWHEVFHGKPSFVDKRMDGKKLIWWAIYSCKISSVTVEILHICEYYVTTTIFTLILQNGLLVLVAPKFLKPERGNVKRRTECFSDMQGRKMARITKVHNSIRAAIDHFLCSPLHNKQMDEKSIIRGWEFNKTIIPIGLVGYEIGNSQLSAMCLVGYLPSCIQHGLIE